jgi:phosphoglycolate phosphatase-like HAD superfamily hydrolase
MIKLIIFDWDDVFSLGSKEGYIKCLHDAVEAVGVTLDPEEEHARIQETWSQPHELELANLLREHPELVKGACKLYEDSFFNGGFVAPLSYVMGANELLKDLRKGYKLAISTGAHPKILREQVFPKFSVPGVFSEIMFGYELDDPEKNKPHPHMLEIIMQRLDCKPAETIYVGDARNDVLMARGAGVEPVVVLTGHLSDAQAKELDVKYIISDVTKLLSILEKLK